MSGNQYITPIKRFFEKYTPTHVDPWYQKFILPAQVLFGTSIAGINVYNYKRSPAYKPGDSVGLFRIMATCGIKGVVYGAFAPLPLIDMAMNVEKEKEFNRHFIPLSGRSLEKSKKDKIPIE